jgi:hypothetical protein
VIRAAGYLLSEAIWTLILKIAPRQDRPDEDSQSTADQVAARTRWVQQHRHPPAGR